MKLPTVLLAEDNPDDVVLVRRAWRRCNLAVGLQVVTDGEAALHYLQGQGQYGDRQRFPLPSLLLLDWKLPRQTGLEVLRKVRGDPVHDQLPVVILTSSSEDEDVRAAYAARANSYLLKPVTSDALAALLSSAGKYWLEFNVTKQLTVHGDAE